MQHTKKKRDGQHWGFGSICYNQIMSVNTAWDTQLFVMQLPNSCLNTLFSGHHVATVVIRLARSIPEASSTSINPKKCSAIDHLCHLCSQFTILRTMESCSLWLMSGVQSIKPQNYFALCTLFIISLSILSPTHAIILFGITALKLCTFFKSFLSLKLDQTVPWVPLVPENSHCEGHITLLRFLSNLDMYGVHVFACFCVLLYHTSASISVCWS